QMKARSPWVLSLTEPPATRLKLFCFPHAGGGGSAYARWPSKVPRDVHVVPVQLPGRENRYSEPAPPSPAALVMAAAAGIPFGDGPFAFFGHSMGAAVAFEVTRVLHRAGRPLPRLLIASSCAAPQIGFGHVRLHEATGDELIRQLRMYGTSEAVLSNQELLELTVPGIRNDSRLVNGYRYDPGEPLPVPIAVYHGDRDTTVPGPLERWGELTSAGFSIRVHRGGHMYLHPGDDAFFAALAGDLAAAVPPN
ncbi:MAG TPA: alpha/beta fold hydrolase, partial [Myxococcaceae bacterium]